jgi:hypothetical protein
MNIHNNYAILGYRGSGSGGHEMKYKINGSKLSLCVKDRKQEWECVFRAAIWSVTYIFERHAVLLSMTVQQMHLYIIKH